MSYQRGEKLYEGKAKTVYTVPGHADLLWLEFKDSLTAFNALKKGSFANKGALNRDIASLIFRYLEKNGINSHRVEDLTDNVMICRRLQMIPLEVVVRNAVAGSFAKKFGLEEGADMDPSLVEFYYKSDTLQDPFISDAQALYLKAASPNELSRLKELGQEVNRALIQFFRKMNIRLIDFKLEFGRDAEGALLLGDEITPDSCRLWDMTTQEKMDKDRFRRDLGKVEESYQEVLNRIKNSWEGQL
jgi:phosphoribosylaminoimidazole-succinocarboxamide synthase